MPVRVNILVTSILLAGIFILAGSALHPGHRWVIFCMYLAAALLSSGLKVKRPSGSGSMSLNYPFIFLAILQLSLLQSCLIAAVSIAVQCRFKKWAWLALVQSAFNVSNSVLSTACAYACCKALVHHALPEAPSLAAAACVYFFANSLPVAMVVGWSQQGKVLQLWKNEFLWYLPFYLVGAVVAAIAGLLSERFGWATGALLVPLVYTVYRAYNAQVTQREERRAHLEETEALHLRTIEGLAMAIEAKDHNTHEHLFRVRDYVTDIAITMGLDEAQKKALQIAAFLHDIGKLAVPEHIINKPGKLTPDEFEKMKIHPSVGADILERVRFPYPVVPIVRSHHERWDGKGYPDGLAGEDIPLGARILSAVDCFDALASDRPYRKAMSLEKAMAVVKSSAGTQFDPAIVAILEQRITTIESSLQARDTFVALNLDVDVQRGDGPAAGLEQDSATPTNAIANTTDEATPLPSLRLIAAASHEAQTLFEMSQAMGTSLSFSETAWVMESRLRALIPFDCCAVYLAGTDAVECRYLSDAFANAFHSNPIPLGEGISGWAAQSGRPILNGNATVEPTYRADACNVGLLSALAVPLCDLQGQTLGVLTLYTRQADSFSRDHLRILQAIETKFSLALQNALRFQYAESNVSTDDLTRLPNARSVFRTLDGELNRCRRTGTRMALLVFDLNRFHRVNDAEGHQAGDNLLRCLAQQLQTNCRNYDTVARVAGDEFVLLLPEVTDTLPAVQTSWIDAAVKAACIEASITTELSASAGLATYPADGDTAEELLAAANRRMYLKKQQLRERSAVHAAAIRSSSLKPRVAA